MKKLIDSSPLLHGTTKMPHYTIQLLGEGGVGKTAWITKIRQDIFEKKYVATVGLEVHPYHVETNHDIITLSLYDYYGRQEYAGPVKPTDKADATILMVDLSRKSSHKNLDYWYQQTHGEPVFVVGNKNDLEAVFTPTYHTEHDLPYWTASAKTGTIHDLLTPILRHLTGYDDLVIQGV
jgi:GTP-binding nuclear protein Ran